MPSSTHRQLLHRSALPSSTHRQLLRRSTLPSYTTQATAPPERLAVLHTQPTAPQKRLALLHTQATAPQERFAVLHTIPQIQPLTLTFHPPDTAPLVRPCSSFADVPGDCVLRPALGLDADKRTVSKRRCLGCVLCSPTHPLRFEPSESESAAAPDQMPDTARRPGNRPQNCMRADKSPPSTTQDAVKKGLLLRIHGTPPDAPSNTPDNSHPPAQSENPYSAPEYPHDSGSSSSPSTTLPDYYTPDVPRS